jgi:hypothetical protein
LRLLTDTTASRNPSRATAGVPLTSQCGLAGAPLGAVRDRAVVVLEETLDEEDRRALAHALELIERISGSIRGGRSFAGEREFNTGSW